MILVTPEGKQAEFIDAIKSGEKYIIVEAPAGTGKTFSCIQAVKTIVDSQKLGQYQKVLVLTFSRNARAQLLKELSKFPLEDPIYKHIDINNYHSFFKKYLDTYRDTIGIKQKLCVVDDDDFIEGLINYAESMEISINKDLKCSLLDDFVFDNQKLVVVNQSLKISKRKYPDIELFLKTAFLYTQTTGTVCFAQFGNLVYKILSSLPRMESAISHDYPVLILDEYQDTNYFQEQFVRGVLKKSAGIFFCDRYQMIYSFRGSTTKRIEELPALYPGIKRIEFDEYYRYKDKDDIVQLLTAIRNKGAIDYTHLTNGRLINLSVDCNPKWREIKNAKSQKMQCTLYCKAILFGVMKEVSLLLAQNQSVSILCRNNIEVDRLVTLFFKKGYFPKEIYDTKDMALIGKHLKAICNNASVKNNLVHILSVAVLCTSKKALFGDSAEDIKKLTYDSFKRKTKAGFKKVKPIIVAYAEKTGYHETVDVISQIIDIADQEGEAITYTKKKFFEQCSKLENPTPENIDSIMLQRQYTNSFSSITPGLYITTIHQSKGKEFDSVFVADVAALMEDQNILYVSHSRMKQRLYPINVKYNGLKYGK